tara:strand:+ start:210 stop:506 length:297 start_codon:yes stop_codon:yes gene_type:complete
MARLNNFPKATETYDRKDPIRDLWRNVLIVAFEDAMGKEIGGNLWANKNYRSYLPLTKASAQGYFLEPSRDFALVCQLAGFDHEYVRMKARKKFKCLE